MAISNFHSTDPSEMSEGVTFNVTPACSSVFVSHCEVLDAKELSMTGMETGLGL